MNIKSRGPGPLSIVVLVACGLALSGCSGLSKALGLSKRPPDEFDVLAKAPLAVPPDFNLRPPAEDELALKEKNPRQMAFQALFPPRPANAMPAVPAGDVKAQGLNDDSGLNMSETGGFSDTVSSGDKAKKASKP